MESSSIRRKQINRRIALPTKRRAIAVLCAVFTLSSLWAPSLQSRELYIGDSAYDFTLKSESGKNLRLDEQRGYLLLVTFWASWCTHCQRQLESLIPIYDRYEKEGLKIWAVSIDDNTREAHFQKQQLQLPFTVLYDPERVLMAKYHVKDIPTAILIDRDGRIQHVFEEHNKDLVNDYEQAILSILK